MDERALREKHTDTREVSLGDSLFASCGQSHESGDSFGSSVDTRRSNASFLTRSDSYDLGGGQKFALYWNVFQGRFESFAFFRLSTDEVTSLYPIDLKIHLQTTAYGDFLDNEPSPLTAATIAYRATGKMVEEFEYLRSCAVEPLSSFLDYIRYGYMIDNVVLLISGTIHESSPEDLKEKLHPLGLFEGINSIQSSGSLSDLYDDILVDTPLAPYIQGCLSVEDLNEMNIEIIRNTLFKAYLEDFAAFCQKMGGVTEEAMMEILTFEADRRSINITLNSFGTEIQRDERFKLYPSLGLLYPEGLERFKRADDAEQVRVVIESYPAYRELFADASLGNGSGDDEKTLEDSFTDHEIKLNRIAFTRLCCYAAFYAYFRLKEQEIRYLVWVAECILQGCKEKISKFSHIV